MQFPKIYYNSMYVRTYCKSWLLTLSPSYVTAQCSQFIVLHMYVHQLLPYTGLGKLIYVHILQILGTNQR